MESFYTKWILTSNAALSSFYTCVLIVTVGTSYYFKKNNSRYCIPIEINNHRIIESLQLEGTSEGHLVQIPCSEQEHVQLDQVAQGFIQPYLESLQGQGVDHITGQSVPVPRIRFTFCKGTMLAHVQLAIHQNPLVFFIFHSSSSSFLFFPFLLSFFSFFSQILFLNAKDSNVQIQKHHPKVRVADLK